MLKKKSLLIISAVALLGLLLSGCSADTANGIIKYDHVAMLEETDPYYIIGFADYVFIGSTLSDGIPVTFPSGNKRLEYDISVSECLKGYLVKEIKTVYPAYYENDGTLVLMEGDTMKDDGLPEKGKNYIFVGTAQPDGSIFLESLYAKTEFNDDNYQRMTENMIEIKRANRNNFCETSMDAFDRSQEVQNVWRMENGRLVLKFRPFTETWSPEQRRKKAGEILSGRFITFCAFEGDAVVGEIMLIPELNEGRLIIDSFHVSRPFRRRGIGRRLVETAADYARGHGAYALYASCCSAEETIDFYRAKGFQLSEHLIPSRVEDEPFDIQMELRL